MRVGNAEKGRKRDDGRRRESEMVVLRVLVGVDGLSGKMMILKIH